LERLGPTEAAGAGRNGHHSDTGAAGGDAAGYGRGAAAASGLVAPTPARRRLESPDPTRHR